MFPLLSPKSTSQPLTPTIDLSTLFLSLDLKCYFETPGVTPFTPSTDLNIKILSLDLEPKTLMTIDLKPFMWT